jgi:hypothetical protein
LALLALARDHPVRETRQRDVITKKHNATPTIGVKLKSAA